MLRYFVRVPWLRLSFLLNLVSPADMTHNSHDKAVPSLFSTDSILVKLANLSQKTRCHGLGVLGRVASPM